MQSLKSASIEFQCSGLLNKEDDTCHVTNGKRKEREPDTVERTDDERTDMFVKALRGTPEAPGILRKRSKSDKSMTPFPHQRDAVKFMLPSNRKRSLLVHDPGLGKTYSILLLIAAIHVTHKGSKSGLKYLISAPASCIEQWFRNVVDVLSINPSLIMITNKICDLTKYNIAKHVIIIASRDIIGRAYRTCHAKNNHLNDNNKLERRWSRIPDTDMHPLFNVSFSLVATDELVSVTCTTICLLTCVLTKMLLHVVWFVCVCVCLCGDVQQKALYEKY